MSFFIQVANFHLNLSIGFITLYQLLDKAMTDTIQIIYAGGTFGSHGKPLFPLDKDQFLPALWQILPKTPCQFIDNAVIKDSSSLTAGDFVHFWQLIINAYAQKHTRFIVITGTDTLSYLAAFLAVALANLPISVVITGSMLPLFEPTKTPLSVDNKSDAWNNLSTAIEFLQQLQHGVFVSFANEIFWGINTQKMHANDKNAFCGTPITNTTPPKLSHNNALDIDFVQLSKNAQQFGSIHSLYALPNNPDTLARQLSYLGDSTPTALILIGFGAGNLAVNDTLINQLKQLIGQGFLVIMSKAPPFGSISQSYKAGAWQADIGIQSGQDMPISEIYARALWICLQQSDNKTQPINKAQLWQRLLGKVARP